MAHLPPVTWNDVATKADLAALESSLRTEMQSQMQALRSDLRAEFTEGMNRQIKWLVTFAAAWTSVLVTVVRLIP